MFLWKGILFPVSHVTRIVCKKGNLIFSISFSGQNRDLYVKIIHESIFSKLK